MIHRPTDEEIVELTKKWIPRWGITTLTDLEDEYWIDYKNSGYAASNFARIKSKERIIITFNGKKHPVPERNLMQSKDKVGYLHVGLGKALKKSSHTIIAECFHPNPDNKPEVNHRNLIKWCNEPWNLEWATKRENIDHATAMGAMISRPGQSHNLAKLTNEQAIFILNSEKSISQLCKQFNVKRTTIGKIKSGKQWSSVTGKKYERSRMLPEKVIQIYKSTGTYQAIADKFGISLYLAWSIKNGKIWPEVTKNI